MAEHTALQQGQRLYIRTPLHTDAAELTALNRGSIALHQPWVTPPITAEQFSIYIERCSGDTAAGFIICHSNDHRIVGVVNLSQIARGNFLSAYMGYYLGAPFVRQGYMTEAIALVLDHAFGPMDIHRIEANIQPGNDASISLVKRLNFTREGYSRRYLKINDTWCDHERWAMLAEDWITTRAQRCDE